MPEQFDPARIGFEALRTFNGGAHALREFRHGIWYVAIYGAKWAVGRFGEDPDKASILVLYISNLPLSIGHDRCVTILRALGAPVVEPTSEEVLDAFAVEAQHDRATLETYLRRYPQHAEDLIDLSLELSRPVQQDEEPLSPADKALIDRKWSSYCQEDPIAPKVYATYRHYKGGIYRVIALARDTETREVRVIYEQIHSSCDRPWPGAWDRTLSSWCETVEVDGKRVPRFARGEFIHE